MPDEHLTQLLINLANAIRDVPESREHGFVAATFIDVLKHLESTGQIAPAHWQLGSRR